MIFTARADLELSLWVRYNFVILCRHLITHLTANSYWVRTLGRHAKPSRTWFQPQELMFQWRKTACKQLVPAQGELMLGAWFCGMMAPFLSQILEFAQWMAHASSRKQVWAGWLSPGAPALAFAVAGVTMPLASLSLACFLLRPVLQGSAHLLLLHIPLLTFNLPWTLPALCWVRRCSLLGQPQGGWSYTACVGLGKPCGI